MKNRILIISNGFPFNGREESFFGVEFLQLAERFDISVMALGANREDSVAEKYRKNGVDFYPTAIPELNCLSILRSLFYLTAWRELNTVLTLGLNSSFLRRSAAVLLYIYRSREYQKTIQKIYDDAPFAMIYTLWCTPATVSAMNFSKQHGLKFITRFHGGDLFTERVMNFGGYFPFRQHIAEHASKLVFLSNQAKTYFVSHWKTEYKRCFISPLGTRHFTTLPVPNDPSDSISLVTTANAVKLKRIDLLIDALAEVNEKYHITWNYFGSGDCFDQLNQYAAVRLTKPNISWKFWGSVPNAQIPNYYRDVNASVFILLSSSEGVPVSIEEALGMGIPCIATNVGGVSEEVIEGKTGFLLNADPTSADVARSIEKYIVLPEVQKAEMREAAVALWNKNYNAEINAKRLSDMIEGLIH